jgi:tetratricopeptide (TPR) repeat protein
LAPCLEIWPNSGKIHFLAAQVARRLEDASDAAYHLELAEKAGWVDEAIDLERVLLHVQLGESESAANALAAFVQDDHSENALILEALSRGYLQTYQLRRALDCLNRWLEIQPDNTQALLWRGQTHFLLGLSDQSLADYSRVVELDSEEDAARAKLADLLLTSNQARQALYHFSRLDDKKPDDAEVLVGLARCQEELGQTDEAIQLLDRLLVRNANSAPALAARGRLALAVGQPAAAERWLRRSLSLAPFEREPLYYLYRSLEAQKRPKEAQELLPLIERIDADRAQLVELRKAIMDYPHDAKLRCKMGEILMRNGQDQEGRRWLVSALKEDPHHCPTHAALASYYRKAGDTQRAAYHHRQSQAP